MAEQMKQLRIPIAVVFAIIMQTSAFIWWTAQQAATIEKLDEEVRELTSRVAAEEQFNLKRDVAELKSELEEMDDYDDRLDQMDLLILDLYEYIGLVYEELQYLSSDYYEEY